MVIKAGTWLGNRTRVFNSEGERPMVKEVDTVAKTAVIYKTLTDDKGRRRILKLNGSIMTETVDASGWKLSFMGIFDKTL